MEKYAVLTGINSSDICAACNKPMVKHGRVALCQKCGSENNEDSDSSLRPETLDRKRGVSK